MLMNCSRALLLIVAVGLAGCGPHVEPYRYIRLSETPGLAQAETGQPQLDHLYFAGTMPTGYRLERPGYTIELAIPEGSYLPALELTVVAANLRLKPAAQEVPPSPVFCGAWYPDAERQQRLRFGWSPTCGESQPRELVFVVSDDQGAFLGRETLRFRLERNGWLVMVDAV